MSLVVHRREHELGGQRQLGRVAHGAAQLQAARHHVHRVLCWPGNIVINIIILGNIVIKSDLFVLENVQKIERGSGY